MLANGETSYIQSQILIDCQRQKINKLENQNRVLENQNWILEVDLVIWRTWFMPRLVKWMVWQPNKRDVADNESPNVTKIDIHIWKMQMVLPYHKRPLSRLDKRLGG